MLKIAPGETRGYRLAVKRAPFFTAKSSRRSKA
jgi:hypothetical protein